MEDITTIQGIEICYSPPFPILSHLDQPVQIPILLKNLIKETIEGKMIAKVEGT